MESFRYMSQESVDYGNVCSNIFVDVKRLKPKRLIASIDSVYASREGIGMCVYCNEPVVVMQMKQLSKTKCLKNGVDE